MAENHDHEHKNDEAPESISIDAETIEKIKTELSQMIDPVTILLFTRKEECGYCSQTTQLIESITKLTDKIRLEKLDIDQDSAKAQEWKITGVPAIVICGKGKGITRFFGIPSGYEFGSFLRMIIEQSTGKLELKERTLEKLHEINQPVHIQVFVTPTCPYCPNAVIIGQRMALGNSNITCDMVEAVEFQELAQKYRVHGVPKIIINDGKIQQEGAIPEINYLKLIEKALQ